MRFLLLSILLFVYGCQEKSPTIVAGASEGKADAASDPTPVDAEYVDQLWNQIDWSDDTECYAVKDLMRRDLFLTEVPDGRALYPVVSERFLSDDWGAVSKAAEILEFYPEQTVPLLVKMLALDDRTKLRNTADLYYPGAERNYFHGLVIDYDIDHLGVRSGWLLEKIAFQEGREKVSGTVVVGKEKVGKEKERKRCPTPLFHPDTVAPPD